MTISCDDLRRPLVLAAALAHLCACATPSLTQQSWIEARTRNFEIMSLLGEEKTRQLALDLEIFRAAVEQLTTIESIDSSYPIRIFLFDRASAFRQFFDSRHAEGVFAPGLRDGTFLLHESGTLDSRMVLYHEYTHYLLHSQSRLIYPKWYNEGFAEFMSTVELDDDHVWIGRVPRERGLSFVYLARIDLEDILVPPPGKGPDWHSMFYAEAWLLVHYLQQERRGATGELRAYLGALERGEPHVPAFEQAYGTTLGEMRKALKSYLKRNKFNTNGMPTSVLEWPEDVEIRPLGQGEIARRLGHLAIRFRRGELAEALFQEAIELEPGASRAYAGMGDALKFQGRYDEAEPFFARAVAMDAEDPLNHLDQGEYWQLRANEA